MKFYLIKITLILSILSLSITSVSAETKGLQSFEDYPVGPFPEEDIFFYSIDFWFPEAADEPVVEIVEDKDHVFHGNRSVRLEIDGRHDDGSVWLLASIPVSSLGSPGTEHSLSINGWIWSSIQSNINVWPIIAAIGENKPESNETKQEEDFTRIGYTEEKAGWTEYSLKKRRFILPSNEESLIYFAFGISVTWETQRTYWMDYLTIEIDGSIYSESSTSETSPGFENIIILLVVIIILSYSREGRYKPVISK